MNEISFSTIHNDETDLRAIQGLLDVFAQEQGIKVNLVKMLRGTAWTDLMNIASSGRGPDVSHIGSTWVSSMVSMNAVRPFLPAEAARLGTKDDYIPATWQGSHVMGDPNLWAVPWNGFLFVIFFRKDLLAAAGLDPATAFGSVGALSQTVRKLRESSLEIPWLIPYGAPPFDGLLHMAASWVWGEGGEFVNPDGTRVLLNSDASIRGLTGWLDSQRAVPEGMRNLSDTECIELLVQGRACAILSHIRTASSLVQRLQESDPDTLQQIGFSAMTDVPWCAGDNIIIWQHIRGYPLRQREALALVEFLVSTRAQLILARDTHLMPTRCQALQEAYPAGHPLHQVAQQVGRNGKGYPPMRLWRRIEYQLASSIGALLTEALQNAVDPSEMLVRKHIEPTVERLNLVIGN